MQHEQTSEIGRNGGTARADAEAQEDKPLVATPELRALVVKEFKKIEKIEEDIAERRQDIKEAIKRMVTKGLSKKGIKAARARRKLIVKGGLEQMDETLRLICSISALGIQMELFEGGGNGATANGEDDAA